MAYNLESIASGAMNISGHWFTLSGTWANIYKMLDVLNIPQQAVIYTTISGAHVLVLGHI